MHVPKKQGRGRPREDIMIRVMRKVVKDKATDCWVWTGAKTPNGYGLIGAGAGNGGGMVYVHRLMYERYVKPLGAETQVDHICRSPWCVNPRHLEEVARTENMRRQWEHRRAGHVLPTYPTSDELAASFDISDVFKDRQGHK